jgi:3-keto-5-aminohexanoate cleavage enzyme
MTGGINWDKVEAGLERDRYRMLWRPYGLPEIADPEHSAFFDAPISTPWKLPEKTYISVAITGALFTANNNPNQPTTHAQIVEQAVTCAGAGASAIHLHVRDDSGYNTLSYERFDDVTSTLRGKFPELAVDGCLVAALEGEWDTMRRILDDKVLDAAPINTTATYIGDALFAKPMPYVLKKTQLIVESGARPIISCYTDADVDNADRMLFRSGLLGRGQNWLVLPALPGCSPMGNPRQMMEGLMRIVNSIYDVDPDAVIVVCAAGRASTFLGTAALMLGLNIRVGMEDTVWYWPHREEKITSNLSALELAQSIARSLGRGVATHEEYRAIIGLPAAAARTA